MHAGGVPPPAPPALFFIYFTDALPRGRLQGDPTGISCLQVNALGQIALESECLSSMIGQTAFLGRPHTPCVSCRTTSERIPWLAAIVSSLAVSI